MEDLTQNKLYQKNALRLVARPNLPEGQVRCLLMGKSYISRLKLSDWGIEALPLSPYPQLEAPLAEHADMQVVHLYSCKLMSNPDILCKVESLYREYIEKMSCKGENLAIKFRAGRRTDLRQYPESAAYNVLILGKYALYNPKCVDPQLLQELEARYIGVPVRQGYARCASCIVSEDAVITADPGIAKALTKCGIDVLQISPGHIALPGYDHGFIGGAAFKLSKNKLAFTGRLDAHPDCGRIMCFLQMHGVEAVFLSAQPAFDIGSAIPILESEET